MSKRAELTFRGRPTELTPPQLASIVEALHKGEVVLTFHYPRSTEDDARIELPGLVQKLAAHEPSLRSEVIMTYMSGARNTTDDYARFLLRWTQPS